MEQLKHHGLLVGWAQIDTTPEGPVSLFGQYYERISEFVQSPLQAVACAIEKLDENGHKEQAIMVSVDIIWILKPFQDALKKNVTRLLPDFDSRKLFLNATHTHSAPNLDPNNDYGRLLMDKLTDVITAAWNSRAPAGISSARGYAVTGHNRRVQYADGTAEMYGSVDRDDFVGLEGPTDPGVDMLFCWDLNRKLTGIILNVCCPAQVTEAKYYVSADYWHEVRKKVTESISEGVYILGQCGASGDLAPRDLPQRYRGGEPDMWDVPGTIEIGKRLVAVIQEFYTQTRLNIKTDVIFKHIVKDIELPSRVITVQEYQNAHKVVSEIRSREPKDPNSPASAWNRFVADIREREQSQHYGPWDDKNSDFGVLRIHEVLMEQYHQQNTKTAFSMELHVMRLGDTAFATNPFELFTDYGLRIKGRSKASQTFLIQLCCDDGRYLPTQKAILGGGYSALVSPVGYEGGQVLVDETVTTINSLWN